MFAFAESVNRQEIKLICPKAKPAVHQGVSAQIFDNCDSPVCIFCTSSKHIDITQLVSDQGQSNLTQFKYKKQLVKGNLFANLHR